MRHDVPSLITGLPGGRYFGSQPRAKTSMTTMRPPQREQGHGNPSGVADSAAYLEGDAIGIGAEQPAVGDGDAVGVAGEIASTALGPANGALAYVTNSTRRWRFTRAAKARGLTSLSSAPKKASRCRSAMPPRRAVVERIGAAKSLGTPRSDAAKNAGPGRDRQPVRRFSRSQFPPMEIDTAIPNARAGRHPHDCKPRIPIRIRCTVVPNITRFRALALLGRPGSERGVARHAGIRETCTIPVISSPARRRLPRLISKLRSFPFVAQVAAHSRHILWWQEGLRQGNQVYHLGLPTQDRGIQQAAA